MGGGGSAPARPVVTSSSDGLDRGDLRWAAKSYAKGPDPVVAVLESSIVGFGAGHFYSGNKEEGMAHLAVQGGSLGLYVIGALVAANASTSSGARAGSTMSSIGIVGLSVGRIADVYRAPLSAEAARMRSLSGR